MLRPFQRAEVYRTPRMRASLPHNVSLIEFRRVQKSFGSKVIYRDLSLRIEKGESLTIIGGSGQGKSVMLKMLIGLLEVDSGEVVFDGTVVSTLPETARPPIRRRIGMLFQGAALFDSLDVFENVAYGLREHLSLAESEIASRVFESLEFVGLPGVHTMMPADLSGGMRKRVGLARAIAVRPEVLLYDEPTTGLDPINVMRINRLITHLKKSLKVTSVVVTHDMQSASLVSDRVAMIHEGQVVFVGSVAELKGSQQPQVRAFLDAALATDLGNVS